MLTGAHVIISSKKPEADRAFLKDVFGLPHVDVGGGWLIFGLPPAEVAIHPASKNNEHEFYFMVDDVQQFVTSMKTRTIKTTAVKDRGWGLLTEVSLPGGGRIGVYQPRHVRPRSASVRKARAL